MYLKNIHINNIPFLIFLYPLFLFLNDYLNKKEYSEERTKWVIYIGTEINAQAAKSELENSRRHNNEKVAFIDLSNKENADGNIINDSNNTVINTSVNKGQGSCVDNKYIMDKNSIGYLNGLMSNLGHLSDKTFKNERYENFNQFVKQ